LDWLKWFGFTSDPFVTRPLQSEDEFNNLFIKTAAISREFSSFVDQVKTSPFLKLVVGKRGIGKSTALQYAVNLCHKSGILAIYVGLYPHGIKQSKEPTFEIARQLMHSIIQEFICSIHEIKHNLFLKYKSTLINWGKYIGLSFDEIDGFTRDPTVRPDFEMLKDILFGFLNLLQRNNVSALVAIDNLDKLDTETVKMFLRGAAAQPLFEKLNSCGVSVLIATDPNLINIVDKDPDLSFLRQKIILEPLSPTEAENLVSRRIQKYAVDPSKKYYEKEAVFYVCHEQKGITRDILNELRGLFIKAFNQKQHYVSLELAKTGSTQFREIENYYEMIKDDYARKGAEKLLRMIYYLTEKELADIPKILASIFAKERLKVPVEIAQALLEAEVILSDEGLPSGYKLDFCVYQLLEEARKREWAPVNFLEWILKPETVEMVRVQTPGFRAKRLLDRFISGLQNMQLGKEKITLEQNDILVTYSWKKWREEMELRLKRAKKNYEIIDNIDMEDAEKSSIYKQIYYILKDFLICFSKCFAAVRDKPIKFKSKFSDTNSWDFIKASIFTYQKDKAMNFKSFRFIEHIRTSNSAIKRKIFSPTEDDIRMALKSLEEIIVEFSREIENMLSDYISNHSITVEKAEPEFHEALCSFVAKLAQKMGYTEDLDHYRVFRVDGREYVRRGFYRSATNIAELDIVRRKQEIGRKDGKIRYHFFLAEVKRERKQANEKEVLLFLKKCEDLIRILESEISNLPQVLKPKFTLWFISYAGFTPKARMVFGRTQKPPRTQCKLVDINELNEMLREYKLKTYSVT